MPTTVLFYRSPSLSCATLEEESMLMHYSLYQFTPINAEGQFIVEPIATFDKKMIRRVNKPVAQALLQWFDIKALDTT